MEALSFQHYLETQSLITYDEAKSRIAKMSGDAGAVTFTPDDYVLGVCDMTGELMRFSVTSMATNGKLPSGEQSGGNKRMKKDHSEPSSDAVIHGLVERAGEDPELKAVMKDVANGKASTEQLVAFQSHTDVLEDKMEIDEQGPSETNKEKPRTVLDDLRAIRLQLEMFDAPGGSKFSHELDTKKMPVMRECVDKVEKALYGLTVRGSERPKGWMPDMSTSRAAEVESY